MFKSNIFRSLPNFICIHLAVMATILSSMRICGEIKAFVVTDRELTKISYEELFDVFGNFADGTETLDEILAEQKEGIYTLLKKIEEGFGNLSIERPSKVCDNVDHSAKNEYSSWDTGSIASLGFIEVTNLPSHFVDLRERLLPRASDLAHLSKEELGSLERPESGYSIGWSHGRETFRVEDNSLDFSLSSTKRYDTAKGSFYIDPFVNSHGHNVYPQALQPSLEDELLEMTTFMAKVGSWIAILCDLYLLDVVQGSIERSGDKEPWLIHKSLQSGRPASKARLLYYFPTRKEQGGSIHKNANGKAKIVLDDNRFDDWCGWHKDHGCLTALLPGMIFDEESGTNHVSSEPKPTAEKTNKPGLYIRTSSNEVVHVDLAPTSMGFQLGETLEILSQGKFRATPHAVKGSRRRAARASLALFLQPLASQTLPPLANDTADSSLQHRWRTTFGEFAMATMEAFS